MTGQRILWLFAAAFCTLAAIARAEPSAVVADDVPITVGQTMQNDASLADVHFIDGANGWAVGDRGVIWHTADGGQSWQLQASGVTCRLASISFVDSRHGWAAGGATQPYSHSSRGVILSTDDGGAAWAEVEQVALPEVTRVRFFDQQRGIAAGDGNSLFPSGVFATRDGGRTWLPLPSDARGDWLAADFPDLETGSVAGAAGRFATLMRRNVVSSPAAVSSSRAYRAVRLAPPTGGWLVGDGGLVMTTSDLGASWQTPTGELPPYAAENFDFHAVAVVGAHAWVAGSPGTRVFHSPDNGQHWESLATGQNAPLRAIAFVDANTGYAVGDLGTILATADGGRTWQVERRGGERAALFVALARETDVPLELVGKFGAEEGYLTTVSLLHPKSAVADGLSREAMLLAGATAADVAWQFPPPPADGARTSEELLAELNRANDGRAAERIEGYLVRQLRTWRPDVVVTHHVVQAETDPLGSLVEQLVNRSLQAASDPNQYTELATKVGLNPWSVRKVYGLLPPGCRGEDRFTTGQFAPRLGATLADWAEPARRLVHASQTAAPDAIELQLKAVNGTLEPDQSRDVFAGLRLAPGGDARRRLANLPSDDVERLRRLAARRRQMRVLLERSQGNAAWAGQVANLTDGLDPASAGELLFELADGYQSAGQLDLAADTYATFARRWPEHPLVESALRWLVQFYTSGETAQRLADRDATNIRGSQAVGSAEGEVRQASAVAPVSVAPVMGLSRDSRLRRAAALGQYLETARPALYADPSVRFPLVVAQRHLGFANPAQRYFLMLHSLPENDPWRRCGETEQWFAKSEGLPPPKTLGNCRRATGRPQLDGKLDEPLWHTADRLRLSAESRAPSNVRFTYDREFLYLAIQCPKAKDVDYSPDDRPRPRDADLSGHDRVVVRLDVDRDYATAYELAIDHRGWTHDACWNDATWNPTWYVAAAADAETWTVEAAIPLAELVGEPPATRDVWAASIERKTPRDDGESWSGDATSDDSPDKFGLLIFE
jgi:photosystem II stability/assembly factor-like uncharacterized protein